MFFWQLGGSGGGGIGEVTWGGKPKGGGGGGGGGGDDCHRLNRIVAVPSLDDLNAILRGDRVDPTYEDRKETHLPAGSAGGARSTGPNDSLSDH